MKKAKQEEEEKQDNLEIVSIGVLYEGPWHKKYWSNSRGKDRYPYPVGYQSARVHNGSTYKMEIHEGLKGPLFVITSSDGESCSGQTADITWEKLQKQCFPSVKLLRGKRLSCKIDGVEFFGFRNSFVQRLLRELVANVNETTKQSSTPSSFGNGATGTELDSKIPNPCTSLDPRHYLARPRVTGKRSRNHKITSKKSIDEVKLKKSRSDDLICKLEDSYFRNENQKANTEISLKNLSEIKEEYNKKGDSPVSGNLKSLAVASSSCDIFPNKTLEKTSLDSPQGCGMHEFKSSTITGESTGEAQLLNDAPTINDEDLCAPDTLDEGTSYLEPTIYKEKPCCAEDKWILSHVVNSEELAPELHPDEMSLSTSNANSEKSDFDSVGENIAKSMMTLLLPQALPLLKKGRKKKKANVNPLDDSGKLTVAMHPARALNENYGVEREENMHTLIDDSSPVVQSPQHVNSAIYEGLNIDHCEKHVNSQVDVYLAEADQATHKNICAPVNNSLLSSDDTLKVSLPSDDRTKSAVDVNYPQSMPQDDGSHKGDIILPKSALPCTYRRKKKKLNKSIDVCPIQHESSSIHETHAVEKLCRISPEYTEVNPNLIGTEIFLPLSDKVINFRTEDCKTGNVVSTGLQNVSPSTRKHHCSPATGTLPKFKSCLMKASNEKKSVVIEASIENKHYSSPADKSASNDEGVCYHIVHGPPVLLEECHSSKDEELVRHADLPEFSNAKQFFQEQTKTFSNNITAAEETQAGSGLKLHMMEGINGMLGNFVELVGCYVHPMPISSVISCITESQIYLGVVCGPLMDKAKTLFIYKIPIIEPRTGCPSFVGHASIMMPGSKGTFCGRISPDRADLQFTPDGKCLVLFNSIKAPYCREGKLHCPCSACTSDCIEENAIKIVQVKFGYVSLVAKMKTDRCVLSMLICRPNHLVAVEEGGRLHLWVMNAKWSAKTEEFFITASDCISPCVEELKQIPKCPHLVIGHNGHGEFILWDIYRRVIISRFSAPSKSILQFLPISLFGWKKSSFSSNPCIKDRINNIMTATKASLLDHSEDGAYLPFEEKEMGIWLLVSTVPDSDDATYNSESNCEVNLVGWWRLALLLENSVVLGDALYPRVSAIGASAGCGIIATCEGLVYMWELATGTKLGTLHYFKDGGVSCISTDYSRSGVLAVAGDGGQLRVYLQHPSDFAD